MPPWVPLQGSGAGGWGHSSQRMKNIKTIGIHLLFWLLYVASEYFANMLHMDAEEHWRFFRGTFLSLPALMLATYVMVYYL